MANRYDTLKLEKGMYQEAGSTFTQVLEREDPSEQYRGTAMEGLETAGMEAEDIIRHCLKKLAIQ